MATVESSYEYFKRMTNKARKRAAKKLNSPRHRVESAPGKFAGGPVKFEQLDLDDRSRAKKETGKS